MESRGSTSRTSRRQSGSIHRSCDSCRARKIACDRLSPCSNCQLAQFACEYSRVAKRKQPYKRRVLISAEYEKKIDAVVRDVAAIKILLQSLVEDEQLQSLTAASPEVETQANDEPLPDPTVTTAINQQNVDATDTARFGEDSIRKSAPTLIWETSLRCPWRKVKASDAEIISNPMVNDDDLESNSQQSGSRVRRQRLRRMVAGDGWAVPDNLLRSAIDFSDLDTPER